MDVDMDLIMDKAGLRHSDSSASLHVIGASSSVRHCPSRAICHVLHIFPLVVA